MLLKQRRKVAVEMNQKVPAVEHEFHRGILPRHL
jgi:hypothetical protein